MFAPIQGKFHCPRYFISTPDQTRAAVGRRKHHGKGRQKKKKKGKAALVKQKRPEAWPRLGTSESRGPGAALESETASLIRRVSGARATPRPHVEFRDTTLRLGGKHSSVHLAFSGRGKFVDVLASSLTLDRPR
jgi:hypothetical protein